MSSTTGGSLTTPQPIQKSIRKPNHSSGIAIRKQLLQLGIKNVIVVFSQLAEEVLEFISLLAREGESSNNNNYKNQLEEKFKQLSSKKLMVSQKLAETCFGQIMHLIELYSSSDSQNDISISLLLKKVITQCSYYFNSYSIQLWLMHVHFNEGYFNCILQELEDNLNSRQPDIYNYLTLLSSSNQPNVLDKIIQVIDHISLKINQNNMNSPDSQYFSQDSTINNTPATTTASTFSKAQEIEFVEFVLKVLEKSGNSSIEKDVQLLVQKQHLQSVVLDGFMSVEENFDKFLALSIELLKKGLESEENELMLNCLKKGTLLIKKIKANNSEQDGKVIQNLIGPLFILKNSLNSDISKLANNILKVELNNDKDIKEQAEELLLYLSAKLLQEEKSNAIENTILELIDKQIQDEDIEKIKLQKKMQIFTNITYPSFSKASNQSNLSKLYQQLYTKFKFNPQLAIHALCRTECKYLNMINISYFKEFFTNNYNSDIQVGLNNFNQLIGPAAYLLFQLNNQVLSEEIENKFKINSSNSKQIHIPTLKINMNAIHQLLSNHSEIAQCNSILSSNIYNYFKLERLPQLKSLETLYTKEFIEQSIKDNQNEEVSLPIYYKVINQSSNAPLIATHTHHNNNNANLPHSIKQQQYCYKSLDQKRQLYREVSSNLSNTDVILPQTLDSSSKSGQHTNIEQSHPPSLNNNNTSSNNKSQQQQQQQAAIKQPTNNNNNQQMKKPAQNQTNTNINANNNSNIKSKVNLNNTTPTQAKSNLSLEKTNNNNKKEEVQSSQQQNKSGAVKETKITENNNNNTADDSMVIETKSTQQQQEQKQLSEELVSVAKNTGIEIEVQNIAIEKNNTPIQESKQQQQEQQQGAEQMEVEQHQPSEVTETKLIEAPISNTSHQKHNEQIPTTQQQENKTAMEIEEQAQPSLISEQQQQQQQQQKQPQLIMQKQKSNSNSASKETNPKDSSAHQIQTNLSNNASNKQENQLQMSKLSSNNQQQKSNSTTPTDNQQKSKPAVPSLNFNRQQESQNSAPSTKPGLALGGVSQEASSQKKQAPTLQLKPSLGQSASLKSPLVTPNLKPAITLAAPTNTSTAPSKDKQEPQLTMKERMELKMKMKRESASAEKPQKEEEKISEKPEGKVQLQGSSKMPSLQVAKVNLEKKEEEEVKNNEVAKNEDGEDNQMQEEKITDENITTSNNSNELQSQNQQVLQIEQTENVSTHADEDNEKYGTEVSATTEVEQQLLNTSNDKDQNQQDIQVQSNEQQQQQQQQQQYEGKDEEQVLIESNLNNKIVSEVLHVIAQTKEANSTELSQLQSDSQNNNQEAEAIITEEEQINIQTQLREEDEKQQQQQQQLLAPIKEEEIQQDQNQDQLTPNDASDQVENNQIEQSEKENQQQASQNQQEQTELNQIEQIEESQLDQVPETEEEQQQQGQDQLEVLPNSQLSDDNNTQQTQHQNSQEEQLQLCQQKQGQDEEQVMLNEDREVEDTSIENVTIGTQEVSNDQAQEEVAQDQQQDQDKLIEEGTAVEEEEQQIQEEDKQGEDQVEEEGEIEEQQEDKQADGIQNTEEEEEEEEEQQQQSQQQQQQQNEDELQQIPLDQEEQEETVQASVPEEEVPQGQKEGEAAILADEDEVAIHGGDDDEGAEVQYEGNLENVEEEIAGEVDGQEEK